MRGARRDCLILVILSGEIMGKLARYAEATRENGSAAGLSRTTVSTRG
jgi:hypothetical protein